MYFYSYVHCMLIFLLFFCCFLFCRNRSLDMSVLLYGWFRIKSNYRNLNLGIELWHFDFFFLLSLTIVVFIFIFSLCMCAQLRKWRVNSEPILPYFSSNYWLILQNMQSRRENEKKKNKPKPNTKREKWKKKPYFLFS